MAEARTDRYWKAVTPVQRTEIAVFLLTLLVVALVLVYSAGVINKELTSVFDSRGSWAAKAVAVQAGPLLDQGRLQELHESVEEAASAEGVIGVVVLDELSAVRATAGNPRDDALAGRMADAVRQATDLSEPILLEPAGCVYVAGLGAGNAVPGRAGVLLSTAPLKRAWWPVWIALAAVILGGAGVATVIRQSVRSQMRLPVMQFVEAARRLAEGKNPDDIPLPQDREFRTLARAFRDMSQMFFALMGHLNDTGRDFTPRKYSSYISHELRNGLQRMLGLTNILALKANDTPNEVPVLTEDLERQILTLHKFCSNVLDYATPVSPERQQMDVNAAIQGIARDIGAQSKVSISLELDPATPIIRADAHSIERALLNLVRNAIEAMPGGGTLTITTRPDPANEGVRILIADSGCGIPEAVLPKLFQPFQSHKAHGSGLGLAIVAQIVSAHEGTIEIKSDVGMGTTVTMVFPPRPSRQVHAAAVRMEEPSAEAR